MSAESPETVATYELDGTRYEIDHLGVGRSAQWGCFAVYRAGRQVADFEIVESALHPEVRVSEQGLRFRIWVSGVLVIEEWISDPLLADEAAERHARVVDTSQPWLVEIFDPDESPERAYTRFGSDAAGMGLPIPVISGWVAP